jgi:hypothetical protein
LLQIELEGRNDKRGVLLFLLQESNYRSWVFLSFASMQNAL